MHPHSVRDASDRGVEAADSDPKRNCPGESPFSLSRAWEREGLSRAREQNGSTEVRMRRERGALALAEDAAAAAAEPSHIESD